MDSAVLWGGLLLAGVAAGVISSGLGLGGGVVMVPALLAVVPGMDSKTATGTSLFIIIFVSALNAWRGTRAWPTRPWRAATLLGAAAIVGSYAAGWITGRMSEEAVLGIFIVLLGGLGLRTFFLHIPEVKEGEVRRNDALLLAIGLGGGIVGGATGTGGGLVMVPLLLIAGLECNARVVGLSNMVIVVTAIAGSAARLGSPQVFSAPYTVGQVCFAMVPVMFLGAQLGSPFGERLNRWLTLERRKVAMGIVLLLIAAQLSWRALQ